jgi:CubicO group peptidase (beta-lactamase class C family)
MRRVCGRWQRRLAALTLCVALPAAGASTDDRFYDETFAAVMARYHLPGLAVGVIENGKVAWTRSAGELAAGSGQPVTAQTLFKIASNSKAMTTALLARLVAAGKLDWDDPVTKFLPAFRMHDPWVTQNMLVRDLLVHDSGLREGAGDLMLWPEPNRFTRADIIAGLAYLKPQTSFRSGYAYDNLMYVVAGEVAAAAGGAPYEELMRREVFAPLGLSCRVGAWRRDDAASVAQPHMRKDGRNVVINADAEMIPAITSAAAGGIRCSLDDMLAWARNWLDPDARQLAWLSAAQRRPLWTPHMIMPLSQRRREWDHSHFLAYGFGWRLTDVDGVWSVSHTGTLSGMYSALSLLPDRRNGFVLMTNGEGSDARSVLSEVLLKHFTAPGEHHGVAEYADVLAREHGEPAHRVPDTSARVAAQAQSASALLGIWRDPWFGEVSICAADSAIRFVSAKSPLMRGRVMQFGKRYLVAWDDERVDAEAWLDLDPGASAAARLRMSKIDPDADFSFDYEDLAFERERDCD